jgi:hypothetical protein
MTNNTELMPLILAGDGYQLTIADEANDPSDCAIDLLERCQRERDEARDAAVKAKAYKRLLKQTNAQLKRERDELKALLTKEQDACARERKRWEASLCKMSPPVTEILLTTNDERACADD